MRSSKRRAISPIIATVLIIAVTLIAAVAIGGFVFGIFGSSSSSAQVQVTSQNVIAADFGPGGATTFACNIAATAPFVTLTNTGTSATTVTGLTITWAGAVNSFTPSNSCTVAAAGKAGATSNGNPISLNFATTASGNLLTVAGVTGQTYTGTVTMGNGAVLLFTGTFN